MLLTPMANALIQVSWFFQSPNYPSPRRRQGAQIRHGKPSSFRCCQVPGLATGQSLVSEGATGLSPPLALEMVSPLWVRRQRVWCSQRRSEWPSWQLEDGGCGVHDAPVVVRALSGLASGPDGPGRVGGAHGWHPAAGQLGTEVELPPWRRRSRSDRKSVV